MKHKMIDRRMLFKTGAGISVGALVGSIANAVNTPPQTEGPFFPVKDQLDKDADLTLVKGHNRRALGAEKTIIIQGTVRDEEGNPLPGVLLDIWQACQSGKYNHPLDDNPAKLDPDFQYWAKLKTGDKGEYSIKTIVPGAYPAAQNWTRPPHIHFKVDAFKKGQLTTQMYFKDNPLNTNDRILQDTLRRFGKEAYESLIVDFSQQKTDLGIPIGIFDITLGRGRKATPATE